MLAFTAITALTLTGYAIAATQSEPGTISIPLQKHGLPFSRNGIVIGSVLARQVERVQFKYARGNAAYKARTGHDLFSGIGDFSGSLAKRQKEPLIDEQEQLWAGNITIGTPGQQFTIDFDTGSADLWVPSSKCSTTGCAPHPKYNPSKSSTSSKQEGFFNITYGDGSGASGPIYSDTVTVAGLSAACQYFSPVTLESAVFASNPSDGIMGLAFSSISQIGAPTFIENLYSQGKISAPTFAFRLASSGSELYLGGINHSKYTGSITWAALTNKTYWLTEGASSVNGVYGYKGPMIIDSGTTIIVGATSSVKHWWSHVPGSKPCDVKACNGTGFYTYPCADPPSVSFTFSGRDFPISPADFNLGAANKTEMACVGAIVGADNVPNNAWVVGDTFMKNVYTVFDEANARVGFATPALSQRE
ncbi:hypothetical protein BN14_10506 [Rhizoctonia solani AG-1 IB]|uniref:Peptidase A1 domain-containing protein n=1 Tax=Thanatephorus cucumeris (strain AG1-IB / isolate 7/3/14) TaxID=1108050 RepID=M5CGM4_THACB|nr:hypothetical protein BN14_10506 [Rhizoctonia solani AG-1 IB]